MHYGIHHYMKPLFLIHVSCFILFCYLFYYIILDIVYTQSGTDYMLPTPVVITNYETTTGSFPNKNSKFSSKIIS
jgi:hypothetical protein